jgi:inosine triphosphate pyrophosphatase
MTENNSKTTSVPDTNTSGLSQESRAMKTEKKQESTSGKKTVFFITSNPNKVSEVKAILGEDFPLRIEQKNIDLDEYQYDDPDLIAIRKCKDAAIRASLHPLIIEDTNLSFKALNGLPGPYIKSFEKKVGNEGLVKLLTAFEDKSASAIAYIAYWDGKSMIVFKGEVPGLIVSPRGPVDSFGWDPIFQPVGQDKTFAELGPEQKNQVSHRVKALNLFRKHVIAKESDQPTPSPTNTPTTQPPSLKNSKKK